VAVVKWIYGLSGVTQCSQVGSLVSGTPIAKELLQELSELAAGSEQEEATMERRNILIVEDDHDVRCLYAYMLAKTGFRVRAAKNGLEALTELQLERPDVILTDIAMPIINGLELIKVVKTSKELGNLPIVAMTSYGEDFQELAKKAGANETVDKSIEEESLCHIISKFVDLNGPQTQYSQ
jgi:CheY-like chemotaxis protein